MVQHDRPGQERLVILCGRSVVLAGRMSSPLRRSASVRRDGPPCNGCVRPRRCRPRRGSNGNTGQTCSFGNPCRASLGEPRPRGANLGNGTSFSYLSVSTEEPRVKNSSDPFEFLTPLNSYERALLEARIAVRDSPNDGCVLPICLYEFGQYAEAVTASDEAVDQAHVASDGTAHAYRAMALWKVGRREESRQRLREVSEAFGRSWHPSWRGWLAHDRAWRLIEGSEPPREFPPDRFKRRGFLPATGKSRGQGCPDLRSFDHRRPGPMTWRRNGGPREQGRLRPPARMAACSAESCIRKAVAERGLSADFVAALRMQRRRLG